MNQFYPILNLKDARAYEDSILCSDNSKTAEAMANAGTAIGRALYRDFQETADWAPGTRILVLCGKGLNTGDALVACDFLKTAVPGLLIRLVLTAPPEQLDPIAAGAYDRLKERAREDLVLVDGKDFVESVPGPHEIVLDALYGLGFKAPLRQEPAAILRAVNQSTDIHLRVSIDLPSGVGDALEPDSFRADITYIPGVPKSPCFEQANAAHVGRIRFLEVNPFAGKAIEDTGKRDRLLVGPDIIRDLSAPRPSGSDKRTFGHCLVMGGSRNMPGAVGMAALGALHGGAGLLTTAVPMTVSDRLAAMIPESMWRYLPVQAHGGLEVEAAHRMNQLAANADACLIGPGLFMDRATTFVVSRIVRELPLAMVLDASALTENVIAAVQGRPTKAGPVVLTPHLGEFARICGSPANEIGETDLIQFSAKYRVITLLKGSPNRISDGERVYVLPAGGPVLARGGSGDILAGILVALLARMPDDPLKALFQAVAWHGAAADSLAREQGSVSVRTTQLLPHLARSLRFR